MELQAEQFYIKAAEQADDVGVLVCSATSPRKKRATKNLRSS